ncbi:MAG: hypothetical protein C4527_08580 [Candidatus Omnitrophota bacterium]|jgi:hypothetical protein|nr:MAG: hypothetical protein C4527_08580 [Candidatus Omnitrophota bacterium]
MDIDPVDAPNPSSEASWIRQRLTRTDSLLVLAQILIVLPALGMKTLWLDEAYSALLARKSLSQMLHALQFDAGPPLYYGVLHFWRFFFGETEAALRTMSLLFAVMTTLLLYRFCVVLFDKKTAVLSAWLWILSPLTVSYALEARNYTLFAALSVAYAFCIGLFVVRYSLLSILISVPVLIMALYTHNFAWFLIPAGFLATLCLTRNRLALSFLLGSYLLAAFFYLPWLPTLLKQMQNTELTIGWVANVWSINAVFATFQVFTPGGATPVYLDLIPFPFLIQIMNAALVFTVIILSFVRWSRERQREITFLFLFSFIALIAPYFYSFLATPIYLAGRTDFNLFPFWCLFLGYGLAGWKNETIRFAFVSILLFQMLILNLFGFLKKDHLNEDDLIRYLYRHGRENDMILCTGLTRPPLEYYLDEKGFRFFSYPRDMENHLAHFNEEWYVKNMNLREEANMTLLPIMKSMSAESRLWLIGSDRIVNQPLFDKVSQISKLRSVARVQSTNLGLRKLNEPLFFERFEYAEDR